MKAKNTRLCPLMALAAFSLICMPRAMSQTIRKKAVKARAIKATTVTSGRKRMKKEMGPVRIDFERMKARQAAIRRNEQLESKKRLGMIAQLEKVLQSRIYKLSRMRRIRSARLLQKATLEYEEAKYQNLLRYQAWEKAATLYEAGKSKKKPEPPEPDYQAPAKTYQQILDEDPSYHKNDEVRFRLGYCLNQMKRTKEAVQVMAGLVRHYPKSQYAADAYLQMGEMWFEANKFVAAGGSYSDLLRVFPRSHLKPYAEYKYAWSLFHQGKVDEAVSLMKKVIGYRKLGLRRQALNDLVVFWAESTDGWIKARTYFKSIGGSKMVEEKLWLFAQRVDSQDKNELAITVINYLVSSYPVSHRAVRYHELFMDILVRLRNEQRLEKGLLMIVSFYAPKSPWDQAQQKNPKLQEYGRLLGEKAMAYVATYYHRQAVKRGEVELFNKAMTYYREFLKRFPRSRQAPALTFYLAEILRKQGQHDEAARRYKWVAERGKSKFQEDSAYQRIYCLAQLITAKGLDRPVETKMAGQEQVVIKKTPLAPLERRFVHASHTFVRLFPKSPDVPSILFKAARIYYDRGQMNEAARQFAAIVKTHGKHKYAAFAGAMALDAFTRIKDWPSVVLWARRLIELGNFKHHSRKKLRDILAATGIKAAEIFEKRKEYANASKALLAVAEEFPASAGAPQALYNAAALLERAGQRENAKNLYEKVLKKYRRSPFAARSAFVLGAIHEGRADFAQAASLYGMLSGLAPIPETADALFNAAVLLEAMGSYSKAVAVRMRFIRMFGSRKEAAKVYFGMGKLLELQKKNKAAEKHYLSFLKKKKLGGFSPTLQVAAWTRAGLTIHKTKPKKAAVYFSNAEAVFKKNRLSRPGLAASYAAWSSYLRAEMAFARFDELSLKGDKDLLARLFQKKTSLLLAAEKQYRKVAAYKDCLWASAAVYKIGMLYARMVDAVYKIPVPKSLKKQEDIEAYKAKLQEMAQPIEEKAINRFSIAVGLAHRQRIYNQWTARAARMLVKYRPDAFPNPQMTVVTGSHLAVPRQLTFTKKKDGGAR